MTPAQENRTLTTPVRFTAEEAAVLGTRAARKGVTIDEYMRACMGYGSPRVDHPASN
jgi:hypothetical protein